MVATSDPYDSDSAVNIILGNIICLTINLKKIAGMPDKKLADLNYQILHMILHCGDTLSRWKVISSDKCILCNEKETILHLLYECNYAEASWDAIHKALI